MKVLIIDRFPDDFLQALRIRPVEVHYHPDLTREDILGHLNDTEILVMNSRIDIDTEAVNHSPKLKMVLRAGVGMDHIDEALLTSRGVRVHNTKGGNADAVGEQTVGMLLNLRNNLRRADQEVRAFMWNREPNRGWEIGGKTVGIIGYGHTGQSVARKLSGFQCKVLAYDKYRENYSDEFALQTSLEEIFAEAEIVSMHVPLTSETREWANKDFFAQFARPIWFLNLARGPIVNLADLLEALEKKKVIAAALDFLPNEKLPTLNATEETLYKSLFTRENVLLSPHIGGWTHESLSNINGMLVNFIDDLIGYQGSDKLA